MLQLLSPGQNNSTLAARARHRTGRRAVAAYRSGFSAWGLVLMWVHRCSGDGMFVLSPLHPSLLRLQHHMFPLVKVRVLIPRKNLYFHLLCAFPYHLHQFSFLNAAFCPHSAIGFVLDSHANCAQCTCSSGCLLHMCEMLQMKDVFGITGEVPRRFMASVISLDVCFVAFNVL